jgi:hypothetical protein
LTIRSGPEIIYSIEDETPGQPILLDLPGGIRRTIEHGRRSAFHQIAHHAKARLSQKDSIGFSRVRIYLYEPIHEGIIAEIMRDAFAAFEPKDVFSPIVIVKTVDGKPGDEGAAFPVVIVLPPQKSTGSKTGDPAPDM